MDGVCFPIPWGEYREWASVTNIEVYEREFAILHAIDLAFCEEMNKELQAFRERTLDRQRQEVEAAKR